MQNMDANESGKHLFNHIIPPRYCNAILCFDISINYGKRCFKYWTSDVHSVGRAANILSMGADARKAKQGDRESLRELITEQK